MRHRSTAILSTFSVLLLVVSAAQAETKVTLSELHLCCGACVKAVEKAVGSVDGAAVAVDKNAGTAAITAGDDATVQKAVDAVAAAGFHAKSDNENISMKDDSGAKAGNVKRLELTGVHNCCGGCNTAIKKALATVDGIEANTAKPKQTSLVVEGDFDAAALVKALNNFGFHVQVK